MVKILPSLPVLRCRKKTGPVLDAAIRSEISPINGDNTTNKKSAKQTSSTFLMVAYFIVFFPVFVLCQP